MDLKTLKDRLQALHTYSSITIYGLCCFSRIQDHEYERAVSRLHNLKAERKRNVWLYYYDKPTKLRYKAVMHLGHEVWEQREKIKQLWKTRYRRIPEYKEYRAVKRLLNKLEDMGEIKVIPHRTSTILSNVEMEGINLPPNCKGITLIPKPCFQTLGVGSTYTTL